MKKYVFIGGHVTPAIAVIDALLDNTPGATIFFIGRKNTREGDSSLSPEYTLITQRNIPFYSLTTGRFQRQFTRYTIPSLLKIPVGFFQSLYYLIKIKPDMVVSFGGYLAVPVILSARILGIKTFTHEQTLVPGLANRIISYFVDTIALSFSDTRRFYPSKKTIVTGNPIRKDIFVKHNHISMSNSLPTIYITGGNQGSHFLNQLIFSTLPDLLSFCNVIHQTGNSRFFDDCKQARQLVEKHQTSMSGSYSAYDYVSSELIGDIYSLSSVVVSRAGVNTMCELLALGKKALLIPIQKTSHDEQRTNAAYFQNTGLGKMIEQSELDDETFLRVIHELLILPIERDVLDKSKALVSLNAAEEVAAALVL